MEYYKRVLYEEDMATTDHHVPDNVYVEKMQNILSAYPCIGTPRDPTPLNVNQVFVGSIANAENIPLLKSMSITYIFNCERSGLIPFRRAKEIYRKDSGILGYDELPVDDCDYTNVKPYFARSQQFIDHARSKGGKVLIYSKGVSLSGAVAIAYLLNSGFPLLQATKILKDTRRVALTNVHFMEQLVEYARERGLLDTGITSVRAPEYHRKLNGYRIKTAHLPLYV